VPPLIEELKKSGIHAKIVFLLAKRRRIAAPVRRNAPASTPSGN